MLVAACIYLVVNCIRFMLIRDSSEWDSVFVLAAKRLRAGLDIYQLVTESQDHAYSYPPFQAMLAIPFTFLPRFVGRFVWYVISAFCLVLLWRWSWRVSGGEKLEGRAKPDGREYLICILGLLCGMRFVQDNLDHQQTDLVIGALVIGGCLAWQMGRDWVAATCWGLGAAMKGPPLLFAVYLAWRGRWGAAVWMVALAVGVNLLPDLVHAAPRGLWVEQWYVTMIKPMGAIGVWHSDVLLNQSLAGAARRFFAEAMPARALKVLVYLVEAGLLGATGVWMGKPFGRKVEPFRAAMECSAVLLLMLLFSPMSSKPHFCVILLPAFCLARLAILRRDRWATGAVAVCIFLVVVLDRNVINRTVGDGAMWWGSVMWGAVVLWVGVVMAWGERGPPTRHCMPG